MSVAELMKEWIDSMSEPEQMEMYRYAREIIDRRVDPMRPVSKAQILADLEISRQQIESGQVIDFDAAIDEIEAQYGL